LVGAPALAALAGDAAALYRAGRAGEALGNACGRRRVGDGDGWPVRGGKEACVWWVLVVVPARARSGIRTPLALGFAYRVACELSRHGWGRGGLRVGGAWWPGGVWAVCPAGVFGWGRAVTAGTWGQPRHGKMVRSLAIYKAPPAARVPGSAGSPCAAPAPYPVLGLRTLHSAPPASTVTECLLGRPLGDFGSMPTPRQEMSDV